MANKYDIARYILEQRKEMTAMKLQKLMFYCQAWSLVWNEEPLFPDDFQAWENGPVLPGLYQSHRGMFKVSPDTFLTQADSTNVNAREIDVIDRVLDFYGDKSAQWLSNLTHQEAPWLSARGDVAAGERSEAVISQASMAEYYDSL